MRTTVSSHATQLAIVADLRNVNFVFLYPEKLRKATFNKHGISGLYLSYSCPLLLLLLLWQRITICLLLSIWRIWQGLWAWRTPSCLEKSFPNHPHASAEFRTLIRLELRRRRSIRPRLLCANRESRPNNRITNYILRTVRWLWQCLKNNKNKKRERFILIENRGCDQGSETYFTLSTKIPGNSARNRKTNKILFSIILIIIIMN